MRHSQCLVRHYRGKDLSLSATVERHDTTHDSDLSTHTHRQENQVYNRQVHTCEPQCSICLLLSSSTMSRTEVVTVDATSGPHTSSSMAIRAHSPNPPEPTSSQRRSFDKGDEIELGEINNLEASNKTGSQRSNTPTATPSNKIPRWTAHIQFATMCWTLFLAGWNDGTTGPLLPRIQSNYHVSMQIISVCLHGGS